MKQEVHGNLTGIRDSVIDALASLYNYEVEDGDFLPRELMQFLARFSGALNREIAVYITRDGEIVEVSVGTDRDVELRDYRLRRNAQRLSCVRCVHTHPNGDGRLSDVDLSALRSFRYDAMVSVGCLKGEPTFVQAAFLGEKQNILMDEPVRWYKVPDAEWNRQIEESDRIVGWEDEQKNPNAKERAVLMGIESEESLQELARLAETAGAEVVGMFLQKRDKPDNALFIGKGRADELRPETVINTRPVATAIREFFGSSPLSQFMDQNNPLAELTHKRRLSALGPGGLSRDRAGFEVRDVHYSHYGRMCPIETPEGPNIGLISYLATFAKINKYGFIEAPYRRVVDGKVLDEVVYMTADEEDEFIVAQANEPLNEDGSFARRKVMARYRDEFHEIDSSRVSFMDVSPKMLVSVATAMIPFLENDDANRALMGSNMQRQAVPLLKTDSPIVGTGMEYKAAVDSGTVVLCRNAGTVVHVNADYIEIRKDEDGQIENPTKREGEGVLPCISVE